MNLKNVINVFVLSACIAISTSSCKSKVSDADLKAKVETVVASTPGVTVDVKDGVLTLSGSVATEAEREAIANTAKAADSKNIKSVVNNIVVEAPKVEINANDVDLAAKVVDATKDFPTVQAVVKDGIVTVTGTLEQARIQVLKQSLDALSPKKVDLSALVIK
ncbi:BON domain-containing protein [Sphingobacterium bovistauri]|uniref:BON domain-containing protein n=1 Tax=Sphingobacterium bovistauri TaxID=2781959 RepID=A0ABS7Z3A8_9SPHI|nr:BON domain-containing protein [Sphingobacterium bovistauri]MCA5004666.1 BON domain-containing protein [Sphingobacterium bovistauri]